MTIRDITRKVVKGVCKYKPYVDSVIDPALIFIGANAGMLYGLFKLGESDLSDPAKVLALGAGTITDFYINKKVVRPLAKIIRELNLGKVRAGLEARLGSWIKTGLLVTAIATTSPYVRENFKHVVYEAIRPNAEKLVYKGNINNVKLAEIESTIGRIQRTERWKHLTDKYERMHGLPQFTIYSIIMEESYGDPTCINKKDGGAGLIHTQPAKAKEMGLKVYLDCNKIASREHGEKLHELIKRLNYNLDSLKAYDERFDNEKLIAKIAEEIAKYYDKFNNWDATIAAIHTGPNGVYNKNGKLTNEAKRYLKKIEKWKDARENKEIIAKASRNFNKRNWEKGLTFDKYIEWFKNNSNNDKD